MTEDDLRNFKPQCEFLIGIDSDGCVFDTMELKHKECFTPMYIKHFRLQAVSKFAREVWDFVNLYSTTRGANRFIALIRCLNLLRERPEVIARKVRVPDTKPIEDWISRENKLSSSTLRQEVARGNKALQQTLDWSDAVNEAVEDIVFGVPPFPFFRESLQKMVAEADVIVVSQTPTEALTREWQEQDIAPYVRVIAGQELGSKSDHLRLAAAGKYATGKMLMIGDAPGDYKAAQTNGALFFPINPGHEDESWERFHHEGLDRFFAGTFAGDYEKQLVAEFDKLLPENPPWKR